MTPAQAIARARSAIGHGCAYELGHGGMNPSDPLPFATPEAGCDCSGFVAWAQGRPREEGGVWYGTDQIVGDATGAGLLFAEVGWKDAQPGDLLVFPHLAPGRHGHVGLVTVVDQQGPVRAIHCSHGNWTQLGDAIAESNVAVWNFVQQTIVARYKGYGSGEVA